MFACTYGMGIQVRALACVTPTTGASLEPEAPAQCHTEIPRIGAGLLGGAPANLAD